MNLPTDPRELADQLLVVRCQLGESGAFDALIRRWSGPLYRYALKLADDAQQAGDLTQDVWLRAVQGFAGLRDAAQFRPWLFGIAHRTFMQRLRDQYALPLDPTFDLGKVAADSGDGDDERLHQALQHGLASLPLVEREVLTLFYLQELSLADISTVLQIPLGTVKSRLFRARALLRHHFATQEQDHD